MYMISCRVRVVVKTRGGSYPNSGLITEWAPREWNKPSNTIKAVRGSLQRGERRRGTRRHGKWIRVGNEKFIPNHCQIHHFQLKTHKKTFGSQAPPGPDGRRISTDLVAVGGVASRPELGLLPPLVIG